MIPACAPLPRPSSDGYVRLPERALAALQLVHVDSGVDEGLLTELRASDVDAVHAGYTEWQRTSHAGVTSISVAWDWYLDRPSGALLVAWDDVRSNLMGVDPCGLDIGMVLTAKALLRRLARLNWCSAVAHAVPITCFDTRVFSPGLQ
jgi:hypothetical protein